MQTFCVTAGLAVAVVAAFWPRRSRHGWRANDWFAAAGLVTAAAGLAGGLLR